MRRSCAPFSIFRNFLHFYQCFCQNFSSRDPNFSNFRSQDPHFSRKICSLDLHFETCVAHTHQKKGECPPQDSGTALCVASLEVKYILTHCSYLQISWLFAAIFLWNSATQCIRRWGPRWQVQRNLIEWCTRCWPNQPLQQLAEFLYSKGNHLLWKMVTPYNDCMYTCRKNKYKAY